MKDLKRENFILGFQIDDDEVLNGLIEYHKNNEEYKFRSEFYSQIVNRFR